MDNGLASVMPAVAQRTAELNARPFHTFEIPAHFRGEAGCDGIALVALDLPEELAANERARGGGGFATAHQLTMASLRKLLILDATTGKWKTLKDLSLADGSVEGWYHKLDPRVRHLCVTAYNAVNQVEQEDSQSFIKSRKIETRL